MSEPACTANQISYKTFCQLGGVRNSDLVKRQRQNGTYIYYTYHHVGIGQAFWKQDRKNY